MNKQTAVKLIQETFESPFEKERFVFLVKNLFNHIEEAPFIYRGNIIPDAFKPSIKTLERVGKYADPGGHKIDVLIAHLKKETSLERARTMQRNFIAWYLDGSRGGIQKDAAVVAFVSPECEDWRFSIVKMEYSLAKTDSGKIKAQKELTPARRLSFLVGKNENSHTAQKQLLSLLKNDEHNPHLSDFEKAFNIETVTKEFFQKYRELFIRVKESLDGIVEKDRVIAKDFSDNGVDTVNFSKKLLGQIVFLYFLQKKGWFGVKRGKNWGDGSKHFLCELFKKEHCPYKNFFNNILEPLFYEALRNDRSHDDHYFSMFECKIPFLNGGLFDPINDYNWQDTNILLPDALFSNNEPTKEGDKGTGILDVFDRYNFTVKEDEPLEKEVAIDPEMLGKVFENLLEVKDRKSKGTYYTPREIVHYMCQESLINYLRTELNPPDVKKADEEPEAEQKKLFGEPDGKQMKLPIHSETTQEQIPKEAIAALIHHGESAIEHDAVFMEKQSEGKNGKGRYAESRLPESIVKNAKRIDEKLSLIRVCDPAVGSGAFLVGMMNEIVRARNALTNYLSVKHERAAYDFKRRAIQESLYGVDIDAGAVEIAKLRLWLSLVVDEDDIKQIKPLPNLDYKIVCGNSLLGVEKDLLNDHLFKQLEKLKPLHFNETNAGKKQKYKEQIDALICELTHNETKFDFEIYFSEVFHDLPAATRAAQAGKKGFDVVIGNPPYGLLNKRQNKTFGHAVSQSEIMLYKSLPEYSPAISGMVNVFRLFIIRSIKILCPEGFFTQIFPLAFVGDVSAGKLRKCILENHSIISVEAFPERDNEKKRVFEGVKMSVCILNLCKKWAKQNDFFVRVHRDRFVDTSNETVTLNRSIIENIDKVNLTIPLLSNKDLKIILKIYSKSDKLEKFAHCYTGEIDLTFHKKYLTDDMKKSILIKGAMIDRYLKRKKMSQGEIKYLDSEKYLRDNSGAKSQHYKLERIAMQAITGVNEKIRLKMTLIGSGIFCANSVNYIILEDESLSLKYLLAILNSPVLNFVFSKASTNSNVNGYEVDNLPVVAINGKEQESFITLVDKILAITEGGDYLTNASKQAKVRGYEREIDELVYKLYALTPEEIKIVEKSQ